MPRAISQAFPFLTHNHPRGPTRQTPFSHWRASPTTPVGVLPRDECRTPRRAALLSVSVREHQPLLGHSVNVGRFVPGG
jgi:hypothetical protein